MSIVKAFIDLRTAAFAIALLAACAAVPVEPQPIASQQAAPLVTSPGTVASGFYLPIDERTVLNTDNVQAVVNGNVVARFDTARFEPVYDANGEIERVRSQLALRGALTLELRVDAAGELSDEFTVLPSTPLAAIPISETVSVTPYAYAKVHYQVNAAASGGCECGLAFRSQCRLLESLQWH